VIRAIARVVNPLVLRIAGRRHMPILGIVHHRGRKTGRRYATPLGVRPAAGGGFVIPLTFSQASHWYQNIRAAGSCIITYQGADHTLTAPVLVDRATAGPAYPRYERLALRLIGINEYVWLTGHTSLFRSQCADGVASNYLVNLKLPPPGDSVRAGPRASHDAVTAPKLADTTPVPPIQGWGIHG
jgi:deazaflavin-dependent oxidoreductase (nitroreductase family)